MNHHWKSSYFEQNIAHKSLMKILALTDIHAAYDTVERILADEHGCHAMILGGDLTTHGTAEEAAEALKRFSRTGIPLYSVAGNMDPRSLEDTFSRYSTLVNGRGVFLDDVGIFGVSGSPPTPMNTPYEIAEEEIALRAHSGWKDVQAARIKIFVPHAPPRGTKVDAIRTGQHVGSTAVRKFVEQCHPDAVVCGHIHEARGIDAIGSTVVVNCGPAMKGYYAILTVGKGVSVELKG
ncbi:MAG: metallophosphoesterase [Bacteroidia bacterium]|nr:MAG: metallophosphoesterase [Bacteroidia bacterium]